MKAWITIPSVLVILGVLTLLERRYGWTQWFASLYRVLFTRSTVQDEIQEQVEQL